MKKLAILGSTGSIGTQTLQIVRHHHQDFSISALAARGNIDLLEQQIREFHPKLVAVFDEKSAIALKQRLPHLEILLGMEGLQAVASFPDSDLVVSAMAGTMGLIPTVEALKASKPVALANKEALVSGGSLVTSLAKQKKVPIIPIDSEHSALFQCLTDENPSSIRRLILTASGGAFRDFTDEQLNNVTPEQALKHPNWAMGPKVTIDCSTLINKGLEMIEAHWLFNIPPEKIEIIIHPQSIIHSLVEFVDYSMLAQMGVPNMIVPIQYALTHPERKPGLLKPFDFFKHETLQFKIPDHKKFRCLTLCYDAIKVGGSMPCFMNAANEVLVQRFLHHQVSWKEISTKLEALMQAHRVQPLGALEEILAIDTEARERAKTA